MVIEVVVDAKRIKEEEVVVEEEEEVQKFRKKKNLGIRKKTNQQ